MKNKIKIMFFLPNLGGGGAERVAVNMLRLLDAEKFDLSLVLVDKFGEYIDSIPKYVKVHDFSLRKTIFSIFKLRHIVQEQKPDILFSTLFRAHNVVYLSLLGIKEKPVVVLRSSNSPKLVLENNQLGKLSRFLLEKAYENADFILAQTPEMKDEIVKYHHISGAKIDVFLNPLDTDLIDEKIKNIKNPFDATKVNVVAAGRLTRQKGFDVLIKSFHEVVNENSDFVLHIIGNEGGEQDNLKRMVHNLKLESNIKFLGFQDNPYRYFFFSDLYVLSSRWEGLPNTVLENLYLKKPVVATKCIPFMNQLINDGENGFLVEVENVSQLADAILKYRNIDIDKNVSLTYESDVNKLFLDALNKSS